MACSLPWVGWLRLVALRSAAPRQRIRTACLSQHPRRPLFLATGSRRDIRCPAERRQWIPCKTKSCFRSVGEFAIRASIRREPWRRNGDDMLRLPVWDRHRIQKAGPAVKFLNRVARPRPRSTREKLAQSLSWWPRMRRCRRVSSTVSRHARRLRDYRTAADGIPSGSSSGDIFIAFRERRSQ